MLIATATMNSDNISDNCTRQTSVATLGIALQVVSGDVSQSPLFACQVPYRPAFASLPEEMLSCAMLLTLANPDAQCAR